MTRRESIQTHPIGIVRSEFKSKVVIAIQTAAALDVPGELEVFPEFARGIKEL